MQAGVLGHSLSLSLFSPELWFWYSEWVSYSLGFLFDKGWQQRRMLWTQQEMQPYFDGWYLFTLWGIAKTHSKCCKAFMTHHLFCIPCGMSAFQIVGLIVTIAGEYCRFQFDPPQCTMVSNVAQGFTSCCLQRICCDHVQVLGQQWMSHVSLLTFYFLFLNILPQMCV